MFTCSECNREFARHDTPGKCPICGEWSKLECASCGSTVGAKRCIDAGRKCPKCGKRIKIPGATSMIPVAFAMLLIAGAGVWLIMKIQDFFTNQG